MKTLGKSVVKYVLSSVLLFAIFYAMLVLGPIVAVALIIFIPIVILSHVLESNRLKRMGEEDDRD